MSFDDFLASLSSEQKTKLMEALMNQKDEQLLQPKPEPKIETNKRINNSSSVIVDENFIVKKVENNNTNNRRKEPVKGRKNNWVDNGEFRDIETPEFERTPRRREAAKKVDLECHVCGKVFKADPKFVYGEFHRCNRCTGK